MNVRGVVESFTYGNDNGNTFRVSMVESMFEFSLRVISTGEFSEVYRSFSLVFLSSLVFVN